MMKVLLSLLVFVTIVTQVTADCKDANEKLKTSLGGLGKQMDDRCKAVPNVSVNKLIPMLEKVDSLVKKPDPLLAGKLPKQMGDIDSKIKAVLQKSGKLNYCDEKDRKALLQAIQDKVMQYAFPVKMAYDKNCNDYAKFMQSPAGQKFVQEMGSLITTSMA